MEKSCIIDTTDCYCEISIGHPQECIEAGCCLMQKYSEENPEWVKEDFEKAKTYKELFRDDTPQVPEEKEKD